MRATRIVGIIGVLLVAAVIGFVISGAEPLYGQGQGRDQGQDPIPNLLGVWQLDASFYVFDEVIDPSALPEFIDQSGDQLTITEQKGRVFAGFGTRFENKLTGAILSDGTVSIQFYEPDETRGFLTGSIDRRGTRISGYLNAFDDFWSDDIDQGTGMGSGVFELVKLD